MGSLGFHDLFNHYLCFFSKHNEYCKTEAHDISVNFSRFLSDFYKYKTSMGLYNGKTVAMGWLSC